MGRARPVVGSGVESKTLKLLQYIAQAQTVDDLFASVFAPKVLCWAWRRSRR